MERFDYFSEIVQYSRTLALFAGHLHPTGGMCLVLGVAPALLCLFWACHGFLVRDYDLLGQLELHVRFLVGLR